MNERMNERTNGNHRYEGYDGMVETEPIRLIKVYRMRARKGQPLLFVMLPFEVPESYLSTKRTFILT